LKLRADEGRRALRVFARGGSVFGCNEDHIGLDAEVVERAGDGDEQQAGSE
jgi:hypothetical protein